MDRSENFFNQLDKFDLKLDVNDSFFFLIEQFLKKITKTILSTMLIQHLKNQKFFEIREFQKKMLNNKMNFQVS